MAKTKTYRIARPNGSTDTVIGQVEMIGASGALRVRPEGGAEYLLSPSGWWALEEVDGER